MYRRASASGHQRKTALGGTGLKSSRAVISSCASASPSHLFRAQPSQAVQSQWPYSVLCWPIAPPSGLHTRGSKPNVPGSSVEQFHDEINRAASSVGECRRFHLFHQQESSQLREPFRPFQCTGSALDKVCKVAESVPRESYPFDAVEGGRGIRVLIAPADVSPFLRRQSALVFP